MQLLLEEHGYHVSNLGACVPLDKLVECCVRESPAVVVLSTVNGHGHLDGVQAVRRLREVPCLAPTPIAIGGKLGIQSVDHDEVRQLRAAGFDGVFTDSAADLNEFGVFLRSVAAGRPAERRPADGALGTGTPPGTAPALRGAGRRSETA